MLNKIFTTLSTTLMLLAFTTNILKADMMFYYSAAVLPSIVGQKDKEPDIKPMVSFKDNAHGYEPWIVDIENNKAHMVKDIHTEEADAIIPDMFVTIEGITYFFADDGINGFGLWKTDGSQEGTVLVKNYHNTMTPKQMFEFKGKLHFVADVENYDKQLWVSDGSREGTICITQGLFDHITYDENILPVGDMLYFSAVKLGDDIYTATQLWKSDGSSEGTEVITNFQGYGPDNLVDLDGILYFRFFKRDDTKYLYRTDGTLEGIEAFTKTFLGPNIPLVALNSQLLRLNIYTFELEKFNGEEFITYFKLQDDTTQISKITVTENMVYFVRLTNSVGSELIRTNGTISGTQVIQSNAYEQNQYTGPKNLTHMNDTLYFTYTHIDGILAVKDDNDTAFKVIDLPHSSLGTGYMKAVDNMLYIRDNRNFLVSSGTQESTVNLKEFSGGLSYDVPLIYPAPKSRRALINQCGNKVCIFDNDEEYGFELWSTDGTVNGTAILKDINPGNKNSVFGRFDFLHDQRFDYNKGAESTPSREYIEINNNYVFIGRDGSANHYQDKEFFVSDGTESGTHKLVDSSVISPYVGLEKPEFTLWGSFLYFMGEFREDMYLCKTDGTTEGTSTLKEIGSRGSVFVNDMVLNNESLYFAGPNVEGTNYKGLWKSDGTEEGTVFVKDMKYSIEKIYASEDGNLYARTNNALWVTDGNSSNIIEHVLDANGRASLSKMFNLKNKTYLLDHYTYGIYFYDVNISSVQLAVHAPGRLVGRYLGVSNNSFYFDANFQRELWKSDGTQEGTVLVKDGFDYLSVEQLVVMDNKLFFVAADEAHGAELWTSDGTTEGTVMIKDITAGPLGSQIKILNIEKGKLLFTVTNEDGIQLWTSDGTEAGTKVMDTSNH